MYRVKVKLSVLVLVFLSFFNVASAALTDLGNGLVNDSALNISWMKDANLVKTSCDANNALWQAFNPTALPLAQLSGNNKAQICNNANNKDGMLNWFEAEAWISVLNAQNYLGYNDWRQPSTNQPDANCEIQIPSFVTGGLPEGISYNCNSELANLFNVSLANPNEAGTGSTGGLVGSNCFNNIRGTAPVDCFQNVGPFINAQSYTYWSGTTLSFDPNSAWYFHTDRGPQGINTKISVVGFAWPVRTNIATPQSVPTVSLWGLGIMSLLLTFVARRKAR